MVKKKKKEGGQSTLSTDDSDYIVFLSDDTVSESDSDDSSLSGDESSFTSDDESVSSSPKPTLVINIHRTVIHSSKHVRFSDEIITHMVAIEDRKGYWTEDMFRFKQRCASVQDAISFIFEEVHRRKMRLIVNMSDTLRGAILPYSNGFNVFERCEPSLINPTIFYSRGHATIAKSMRPRIAFPMPTWWRSWKWRS